MKLVDLTYSTLLEIISAKNLLLQFSETSDRYFLFAIENHISWESTIIKGTDEATDFETNYKSSANKPLEYRSTDGLVKVASAKFVEALGFYLTGEADQADLAANSTGYIKYHFDDPYTLSGVTACWKDSNFGDYLDLEVGVYTDEEDEETFLSLSKFASQFKIMGTDHVIIDVPTVKTVPPTINIGFGDVDVYIRIKAVNVGSSPSKVIVNLVGWM